MPAYDPPAIGDRNWGQPLVDSINYLKEQADSAIHAADLAGYATTTDLGGKVDKGDLVISAREHGVKADGVTDDSAALAEAVAELTAGSTLLLPGGNARITSTPTITVPGVTVRGDGYYHSRIYADGCDGIHVASGVSGFRLENIEIACRVRHTTTPNTLIGIRVDGSTSSRPSNHVYRDVYVDGFQTAYLSDYLWSSRFDNFRANYGQVGIHAYGLSVNNVVLAAGISTDGSAGSRGVLLDGHESEADATAVASEGWIITGGSVIDNCEINVEGRGVTHVTVTDNILDHAGVSAVVVGSNGTNFGGNWTIANNYVAMGGPAGSTAISLTSGVSNAVNSGCRITGNYVLTYTGSACTYGIRASVANAGNNTIVGNTVRGFSSGDIRLDGSTDNIVTANRCLSAVSYNLYMTAGQICYGNTGTVFRPAGDPHVYTTIGSNKVAYGAAAPAGGSWLRGDRVFNILPAVGSPKGWACTVSGSPGTWVSEGNL